MSVVIDKEKELLVEKTQEGKYEKWSWRIGLENLYEALYEFEINQLRGIKLSRTDDGTYRLDGWKGQPEKCFDTGRTVNYQGNALAVLDDDNHFIFKQIRICEKTASAYMLPVYQLELEITAPDPNLFAMLETNPVPFDCDTFQRDAAAVAERISPRPEMAEQSIIYTGPFRCLILENGTIIRRGQPVAISQASLELIGENYIPLNESAPLAPNYQDLYQKYGSLFLLENGLCPSVYSFPPVKQIASVTNTLKERLKNMIDHGNDYFILQGSDPAEKDSCCPNPLVSELNQLIRIGLMSSYGAAVSGSCPMTIYAFSGELNKKSEALPTFTKNEFLRQAVRKYL